MGGASFRNEWIQDLNPQSQSLFSPTWRCSPLYCLLPHRRPSHGGPWQLQAYILPVEGSQEREKETALVPKVLAKVPMPMTFIITFIYLFRLHWSSLL